jgi:hypothetical protein
MRRELWDRLRDYNRPDFHPDDRDTTELVERWRRELFGEHGTLNGKLTTPAARSEVEAMTGGSRPLVPRR